MPLNQTKCVGWGTTYTKHQGTANYINVITDFPIFAKETKKKSLNTRKRVHLYIDFLQIIHDSYNVELKVIIATKATNFPIKRQGKDFRDVGRFKNKGRGVVM